MPAPTVRSDYDQLTQIASKFSSMADGVQQTTQNVQSHMQTLQNGDWIGDSANKFYAEMQDVVLPAMKRLSDALQEAGRVTTQIRQIMQQAEQDVSGIMKLDGSAGGNSSGGAGDGAAGGASGGSSENPSGTGSPTSGQNGGLQMARDPKSLFKDDYMKSLIGSTYEGQGTQQLKDAMSTLAKNPTGAELDNALTQLAQARGRPVEEIRAEYEKFQQARADAQAHGYQLEPLNTTLHPDFMGSQSQMRYGKVVGDALGIDPAFGALLNPSGGLVGPGNKAFDAGKPAATLLGAAILGVPGALIGSSEAVSYHGIVHDAAGYLYNAHNVGPGYNYLGLENRDTGDPLTGQRAGLRYWSDQFSGTDKWGGKAAAYLMDGVVGATDAFSSGWNTIKSWF